MTLVAAVCVLGACGESDEEPQASQVRELEVRSLAAYSCMPEERRLQLRVLERRHDARIRQLARAHLPTPGTGATAAQEQFRQVVEADRPRSRLLRRARGIYRRYLPGGRDYEPACYLRERERARSRLAATGATGATDG